MELYIVRHGIAEDIGQGDACTDAERALTRKGRARARLVAEALGRLGCRPDCIATSPLRRARQTADILAAALCHGLEPQECGFLAPGADAAKLLHWLGHAGFGALMVVGHMPDLALMASELIAGDGWAAIEFRKGGACRIDFEDKAAKAAGRLIWLIQPRQFLDLRAAGSGGVA